MDRIAIADGWVDLDRGRVHRLREPQPLTSTEVDLLRFLATHQGQTVSREDLLDAVWGYAANVVTRTLDTAIYRLRKKIEPDPSEPVHLLTVHGKGYRFRMAESKATTELLRLPELREHRTFVGREELVEALTAKLASGVPLLTLVGPGGVGKTRLSEQLRQSHRTLLFEVEAARTAGELLQAVGGAFEAQTERSVVAPLSAQSLADAITSTDAELVIIDNTEQVLESTAQLLSEWRGRPMPAVVVTSREPLGLPHEEVVDVEPLGLAHAAELLRLLRRRQGGWIGSVEPSDDALAALIQRVDGLPLALELLSPQLAVLSPAQLSAALDDGGLLLGVEAADERTFRHRTLGEAVRWSWELLSEAEREVLVALATIVGTADFNAVAAVHGADRAAADQIRCLAKLQKHHLARVELGESSGAPVARYRLVVGVREFARATEAYARVRGEFWARHAEYYVSLAEGGSAHGLHVLENLNAIRSRGEVLGAGMVARAAGLVASRALRRGPFALAVEALDGVLPPTDLSDEAGAALWLDAARARIFTGDLGGARHALRQSRALREDSPALAAVEGRVLLRSGDASRAVERVSAGLEAAEAAGDAEAAAEAQADLGSAYYEAGQFDAALVSYDLATRRYERLGWWGEAMATGLRRATVEMDIGNLSSARVHYEDVLRLLSESTDARRRGIVLSNLGVLLHELGELDAARSHLDEGLAVHRALGHRRFIGFSLAGRGFLALEQGDLVEAERDLRAAGEVFRQVNEAVFEAVVIARLGLLNRLDGLHDSARVRWSESRRLFRGLALDWGVRGVDWLEARCEFNATENPASPSQFERLNQRVANAQLKR